MTKIQITNDRDEVLASLEVASGCHINVVRDDPACESWSDDPDYPREDWRHEAANGNTSLGYSDWVDHQREADDSENDTGTDESCECERPGYFYSGVPGILARVVDGRLQPDAIVERCDQCCRYASDGDALAKLVELDIAADVSVLAEDRDPSGSPRGLLALSQDELDEMVHDLKGQEASEMNNQGRDAQLAYIAGSQSDRQGRIVVSSTAEGTLAVYCSQSDVEVIHVNWDTANCDPDALGIYDVGNAERQKLVHVTQIPYFSMAEIPGTDVGRALLVSGVWQPPPDA